VEALQIRTIEDLLEARNFDFPLYGSNISYHQAQRMEPKQNRANWRFEARKIKGVHPARLVHIFVRLPTERIEFRGRRDFDTFCSPRI